MGEKRESCGPLIENRRSGAIARRDESARRRESEGQKELKTTADC